MVRAIKTKATRSLNKGETAVLLPGPTRAEPWELWVLGANGAECLQTCSRPADNPWRTRTTLALPVAEVFCLPLWMNETDSKQFGEMVPLQLELRGLQPRGQGNAIFDWSVVTQDSQRTLLMVGVLPATMPPELQAETYGEFDLSARYHVLPENALTLWQEQDRLVLAITRGPELVYFQTLAENRIGPGVLQDVHCIVATLTMQGVITPLREIVAWIDLPSAELAELGQMLQLPARKADRPAPRRSRAWKLVPIKVTEAKQNREAWRWRIRGILAAVVLYLLVIAGLLTRLYLTNAHVAELEHWRSEHAAAIAMVRDTRDQWRELRPVVDEKSYPLQQLLHVAAAIPADQLNLTLFQAQDGHLLIKAEAKSAASGFQFLDHLKKDKYFAGYEWNMSKPQLLPNNLAQLQIDGTRGPGDF